MTPDRAAECLARQGWRFLRVQLCTHGTLWFALAECADEVTASGRGHTSEEACGNLVVNALSSGARGAA